MQKLYLAVSAMMFFVLSGCAGMYLAPGSNPARLTVHAQGVLDPVWVDDFMNTRVLTPDEQFKVKWGGSMEGPLWGIKAYRRDSNGALTPLRPAQDGMFANQITYHFSGSREFLLPPGHYTVEVWLSAYMQYCLSVVWSSCGTPTLRIWSMEIEQTDFAPDARLSVVLDGTQVGKDEGSPIKVR